MLYVSGVKSAIFPLLLAHDSPLAAELQESNSASDNHFRPAFELLGKGQKFNIDALYEDSYPLLFHFIKEGSLSMTKYLVSYLFFTTLCRNFVSYKDRL